MIITAYNITFLYNYCQIIVLQLSKIMQCSTSIKVAYLSIYSISARLRVGDTPLTGTSIKTECVKFISTFPLRISWDFLFERLL